MTDEADDVAPDWSDEAERIVRDLIAFLERDLPRTVTLPDADELAS